MRVGVFNISLCCKLSLTEQVVNIDLCSEDFSFAGYIIDIFTVFLKSSVELTKLVVGFSELVAECKLLCYIGSTDFKELFTADFSFDFCEAESCVTKHCNNWIFTCLLCDIIR